MSLRTVILIIILILLVFSVSKFLGYLGGKYDPSNSYPGQMMHMTKKVRQMKEDRSKQIEKEEKTLLDQ